MGIYLDLITDAAALADPSITIDEQHLASADVFVNLALQERGINPADVTVPNAVLKTIAELWAKRVACVEGAIGDNSPLIDKAKQYESQAKVLVSMLNRAALGIAEPTGAAFGQINLGRG